MAEHKEEYKEIELFGELFVLFMQTVFTNVNLKKLHLTSLNLVTMMLIYGHSGISMSELAEADGVSMPQLSRTVGKLEHLGLVERRHNQDNRRIVNVYHTDKGQELAEEQADIIKGNLAGKLSTLSDGERKELQDHFTAALALLKKAGIVKIMANSHASLDEAILGRKLSGTPAELRENDC
ncbi:MarR family transcriptional regulator [Lacticaseibacillus pabuli]|uniref:MarR family transcriptional regulator n=1 Tax=Lacticaseibacillus pabuli TaxID=3025672 RepID=A0ABY7WUX9_9LACO|nr:MarR family transcriptional regulator [Lacticaseibacillus sp. KACC 23028]WDF82806.1 MarR family transcriptional regulator [Lacticaseibacillus sp. KACC 23028]